MKAVTLHALSGVGDAALGEWHEWTGRAYHIRRRLTVTEQTLVGDVFDVRGSMEAIMRLMPVRHLLPSNWPEH